MKSSDVEQIEALNDLKFRKKQQAFFKILSAEERLRAKLAQLSHLERDNAKSEMEQMQHIGADVIWKTWVNRTRAALNTELAQILARKEMMRDDVRKDYAKVAVAAELVKQIKSDELQSKNQRQLAQAIALHQIRQFCRSS